MKKKLALFIAFAMVTGLSGTALAQPAAEAPAGAEMIQEIPAGGEGESAGGEGESAGGEGESANGEGESANGEGEFAGGEGESANGEGESANGEGEFAGGESGESAGGEGGESAGGESGESAGGAGGGGGTGSKGQEFGTYDEVAANAGVIIENGSVIYSEDWNGSISGDITASDMKNAEITASEAGGIAISLASETNVYTISGSKIAVTAGEKNNDLGYEAAYGVAVGINTGELRIENSSIISEGARSTSLYGFSTSQPSATSLVVYNSTIESNTPLEDVWMPPFKLLAGGSRATLLMTRNNSWFVNSEVVSKTWGAISQDTVDATTYVINSIGSCTEGGYATYLTWNMYLYASQLYGAQYGVFMCGDSLFVTGTAEDAMADADAMSKTPDYTVEDQPVIVVAPINAVVVHNSLPSETMVAVGNFKNSALSTLAEDLPEDVIPMAADAEFFINPEMDSFGINSGAAFFYNANLYGSLVLTRSMNGDFTFDNTETRSSNNVLVQTVLNYDPPQTGGHITAGNNDGLPGVAVTFLNGEYTGDILHEDYHRSMTVTVGADSILNGAIVSGTYQGWNELWSEDSLIAVLAEYGYDEVPFANEDWVLAVQENLIEANDTAYAELENIGADVTVAAGGTWIVTGTSQLSSLTVEDGGVIAAPEGQTLTVYVNADALNANSEYTGGTETELSSGTYSNVIITVE